MIVLGIILASAGLTGTAQPAGATAAPSANVQAAAGPEAAACVTPAKWRRVQRGQSWRVVQGILGRPRSTWTDPSSQDVYRAWKFCSGSYPTVRFADNRVRGKSVRSCDDPVCYEMRTRH